MERVQKLSQQVAPPGGKQRLYTLDSSASVFTPEQRDFYEANGYIIIPNLVSHAKIDQYAKRFTELCERPGERPTTMTVMRDVELAKSKDHSPDSEKVITKVQDFQDDPALFAFCQDPAVLRYVEAFCGKNIVGSHTMLINKPTDLGKGTSRHPLHQDLLYFPFRPFNKVVAAWTAMERVTRENGCLIAVPGSHKAELLEHGYPDWAGGVNKAYVGIMGVTPDVKYVHLPMEKGDTIFFHPLIWHGSGRNLTPNYRKAISCHFVSGECHFIDVKHTIQEELETELIDMLTTKMRKRGMEITPEMLSTVKMSSIWEAKSRICQGDQFIQDEREQV
ncbi:hypothetical protein BASA81_006762 [Batrachochytrium salamandrivorans]|nr:hypothetical protein BASA81_006762 [Batrachochytrium salamandrivorans]